MCRRRREVESDIWSAHQKTGLAGCQEPKEHAFMEPVRIVSVSGLRGIVGNGLDPLVVAEFAAAFAGTCADGPILVGHDGRVSAGVLVPAVASAIAATGHDAILLGPIATPTIGRLVRTLPARGGVQVSASHNPAEYNGLKCFQQSGMVLSPEQGRAVLKNVEERRFAWRAWDVLGQISTMDDPLADHLGAILATIDVESIRAQRFKVVLDSTHGAGGALAAKLLEALGCDFNIVGGAADGRYEHPPEPTETNLRELTDVVRRAGAHVGFAQDPDADRLAILDENGRYIGEELTLALCVAHRLTQAKGPVVANLSTSQMVDVLAAEHGQECIRTPVGEFHVASTMQARGALIGGEGNGGVIDPRVGWVRDSFATMALVLEMLAARGEVLSTIVSALPRFAMVKAKFRLARPLDTADFDRAAAIFPDAAADRRDGLRLAWPDRWVQLRVSNTEPIARIIAEANDDERARAMIDGIANKLGLECID